MTLPALNASEQRAFDFIRAQLAAGRIAPSYGEIAEHLGIVSRGRAHAVVSALKAKGYVASPRRGGHGLAITEDAAAYTVRLSPELNRRLHDHIAAWAATPEAVIATALADYLGRRA